MWIVAIGWMYVVTLMAATEPTVVGGIMTFFGYGVLPFSIVFYLAGSRRRRARAAQAALRTADGHVPGADGGAAHRSGAGH
jgi:pilus assembly protein TadC